MKLHKCSKVLKFSIAALLLLTISSCKRSLDINPKSSVDISQAYRNVYDADAAVIGIYGKVMGLAKQYELWNELRGDLMDITYNSDQYLRQLSEHTVTADNPYINPRPFYDVILNCNDVLQNFNIMLQQNKFKVDEYNQRYSDVGAVRSWVYLQLAIHFGNIPYVTEPLAQVNDLRNATKFPLLPLKQVIDSLVAFNENLPFHDDYPSGTNLQTNVDANPTAKFFINKNMLLGDLYLWQGQYDKAADYFKRVMMVNGPTGNTELWYNQYRISSFGTASITYSRAQDFSTLDTTGGWKAMFTRPVTDAAFNWEWIWVLPFDKNFSPQNPFTDLFSINGGSYLVKPAQQAIDYWNSQTQIYTFTGGTSTAAAVYADNFPFDSRGVLTYKMINGQPVIMKYIYNYLGSNGQPLDIFNKQGQWYLARAAGLHLHFAEAANRAGKYKVAYALVNKGLGFTYDPIPGASQTRDVSNIQQTFLPYPYDFDARLGDLPPYRNTWYRNIGIRGRANLKPVPVTNPADSLTQIENMIIQEDALELAYEGERWPDLLRVAIRRNDPAFLADKIYDKLRKSGLSAGAAAAARAKLMNKDWFFPFNW
jgi:starch-binding outer membrane protein, SusD/RagB family